MNNIEEEQKSQEGSHEGLQRRKRGHNTPQQKRQREYERASYILSESFQMLDSFKVKSEHNEEQLTLETSVPPPSVQVDSENQRQPRHIRPQEPFISSLMRSFHVVQRGQAWVTAHRDADGTFHYLKPGTRLLVHTALHISAYAVLGALLRIFLVQLFSSTTCHDHDSSDSGTSPQYLLNLQQSANLCIASDDQYDTAVFANLPANLLGCFLMGLFQASTDLGLASHVPLASLPEHHFFQEWKLHHVGLRTGFCGSLTTLASWNSQLCRLADGSAFPESGGSQFAVALMACILGLQGAVSSFRVGQDVAIWIFRSCHPHWAREEDLLAFAFSKSDSAYRNNERHEHRLRKTPLTDYERNFLAFLIPQQEYQIAERNVAALEDLEKWKISTDQVRLQAASVLPGTRMDGDDDLITILHSLEKQVLLDHTHSIPDNWHTTVEENGWDLAALQRFAAHTVSNPVSRKSTNPSSQGRPGCLQKAVAALPFLLALSLLLMFAALDYAGMNRQYYRKLWAATLLAPLGAVLRWKLSSWNGRLRGSSWMWFPLGTLFANWIACIVSVIFAALEDSSQRLDTHIDPVVSFAFKAGFAGCLSTVSSYVTEGVSLQKLYPHHAKAYQYLLLTLLLVFSTGLVVYSPIVRRD